MGSRGLKGGGVRLGRGWISFVYEIRDGIEERKKKVFDALWLMNLMYVYG